MAHYPTRVSSSSLCEFVIRPGSDVATDMANLTKARTFFQGKGGGTLKVDGMIKVNAFFNWNLTNTEMPVDVVGISPDAGFDFTLPAGQFNWGGLATALSYMTPVAMPATAAFTDRIQSPNLALARGDVVTVISDDAIAGMPPHFAGGTQRPMEIHQVKRIEGADAILDDFIVDALVTNPRIMRFKMIPRLRIANLTLRYSGTPGTSIRALRIQRCADLLMENINVEINGSADIFINNCIHSKLAGVNAQGNDNWETDDGYHVVAGLVNNFLFCDSIVKGARHVFTTTSGADSGLHRWGTPRGVRIVNVQGSNGDQVGGTSSGLPVFDTHAEGYAVEFNGCRAQVPNGDNLTAIGFNLKSRAAKLINCFVEGSRNPGILRIGHGARVWASDVLISGGSFDGCHRGIGIEMANSVVPTNVTIQGLAITNCQGPGVYAHSTSNLRVDGVSFFNCANTDGPDRDAIIQFSNSSGTGVCTNAHVGGCRLVKDNSQQANSIHINNIDPAEIKVYGNRMIGYGAGAMGVGATTGANATTLEATWNSHNLTDPGFSQLVEMTAPAAPETNKVKVFAQDNGAGKTQLMARFATGASQQIAIEP